jgi:CRISPR/Cas system-associated exonuclease Cas4 (RecB family)
MAPIWDVEHLRSGCSTSRWLYFRYGQDITGEIFAMVDQGSGSHEADLRALKPTENELVAAAQWSLTQDPSPGYKMVLTDALRFMGVDDADLGG